MKPITQEKDTLGFVGIGYMGRPIARRLLEAGFKLIAYDRDHSKAEELIRFGGTVATSVSELSSTCNIVLSCLPNDEAVLETYEGANGVFAQVNPGSVVIDMSTVYATVGVRMPAAGAAFEINARQSDEGQEQDFSAVILQMEKQAHLDSPDRRTHVGVTSTEN